MSSEAERYFEGAIMNAIDYCVEEWEMTCAQAIGILMIVANSIMAMEAEDEQGEIAP
jgi:hypothetical protein